jgi:hypothetical protein
MSNRFFDFTAGKTAKYLKDELNISFDLFRNVEMSVIEGVSSNGIYEKDGRFFRKEGEDEYMMFYYKKYAYTRWQLKPQLPKYHPYNCKSMKKFDGYIFSNKMPVDITSRNENKEYKKVNLKLCGNCRKEVFKTWWAGDHPWYETFLKYIDSLKYGTYKTNGYHTMWNQISYAYREKAKWCCQNKKCKISLIKDDERSFLHTHHKDGNIRHNNSDNLEALCLLCHAVEHLKLNPHHTGFKKVNAFIDKFEERLNQQIITKFKALTSYN